MATNKPAAGNTILIAQVPVKMKEAILNRANKQGTTASHVLRELVKKSGSSGFCVDGNEVYTDSLFNKIVLKVFPSKHFTIS